MDNVINLPYKTETGAYGSVLKKTYTWYVQWYQNPSIIDTINSADAYVTINSFVKLGETVQVSISIYSKNTITRQGTSGYTCSAFKFQSQPTFTLNNPILGQSITIYNTAQTKSVSDNGSGTKVTSSITHSATVTVSVPREWFLASNSHWTVSVSDALKIVDSNVSLTNTKTFEEFNVAPLFMVVVKKNGELYDAKDIIVRKDGVLYSVDKLTMRVGGELVQG